MRADDVVDRAVEGIADGQPVDWDLLESWAQTEEERERLKCLRILGEIAELHRSTRDPFETSSDRTREPFEATSGQTIDREARTSDTLPDGTSEMWGRYHLIEKVGEGSFGSVYRAVDPELQREIAIKILHRHVADSRLKERLLGEGRALAKVRHANVVSVLGVESHEDRVGLCMEFVPGQTLEHVLRTRGTLNPRETVSIGQDLCRALAAVHQAGFVHRDVKARNVMREQDGRIVLMDFGTGREARPQELVHRPDIAGTPLYMAPEVLAGEPASASSDVYSVGVLLYHLITSAYPVQADSVDDLRAAHAEGRRHVLSERRPDLPARFVRVVERSLAAAPGERYASADALLKALAAVFGDRWTARLIAKRLLTIVLVATVAASVVTALGVLNSAAFNATLERSGFASDTLWELFVWGLRSMVMPTVFAMLALLAVGLFVVLRRLVLGLSSTAVRLDNIIRGRLDEGVRRLYLDDLSMLASWVLVISASALVLAWWYFLPLLGAVTKYISTDPVEDLVLLSPAFKGDQFQYRNTLSWLTVLTVAAWYLVGAIAARKCQRLNPGVRAGGVAIVALSLISLDLPYRLFQYSEFEAATWNGARCYIIGERADNLLLFCPALQPPRNQVVRKNAENLHRLERPPENIFTAFSP